MAVLPLIEPGGSPLAGIDARPPGPGTLAALLDLDLAAASGAEKVAALVAAEKLIRQATGLQLRVLASLPRVPLTRDPAPAVPLREPADWSVEEVSAALMVSAQTAQQKLWSARRMTDVFPTTLDRLADGTVGYAHVHALLDSTVVLDDDTAAAVEARVLGRAPEQTVGAFRRSLRRAVIAADPAAARKRHDTGAAQRRVERWPLDDGLAALYLTGPADDIDAVYDCATELSRDAQHAGSDLGIDALRFDTIKDAVIAAFINETPPTHHGFPVALHVTGAAATLAGLDDEPGFLKGHGPIPAHVLRRLAGLDTDPPDSSTTTPTRWDVLPVDATGRLVPAPGHTLDRPRHRYTPDAELRRYITRRDVRCTFPGCGQPAERCDHDHAHPHADGGATSTCNLHAACRRHHRAKTIGGWTVTPHPDETRTWTSPTGREYLARPPDQLDC